MKNKQQVKKLINELASQYKNEFGLNTNREINQGLCVEFSEELVETMKNIGLGTSENIEVVSEDYLKFDEGYDMGYENEEDEDVLRNLPSTGWNLRSIEQVYHSSLPKEVTLDRMNSFEETGYHVWVEFNGEFYDAECSDGVENLFNLPFYQRFFKRNLNTD